MAKNNIKNVLMQHIEKVGLVVTIIVVILYLLFGIIFASENNNLKDINNSAQKIEDQIQKNEHPSRHVEDYINKATFVAPNEIPAGSSWITYRQPTIKLSEKTWTEAEKNESNELYKKASECFEKQDFENAKKFAEEALNKYPYNAKANALLEKVNRTRVIPKSIWKNLSAKVGDINIEWMEEPPPKDVNPINITSFKIQRKSPKDKDFIDIATNITPKVNEKSYSYVDRNIAPKTMYVYRIVSVTAREEKYSDIKEIKSLGIFKITFAGTIQDESIIYIEKFENGQWTFPPKTFRVKKGMKIGKDSFDTGYVVKESSTVEVDVVIWKCEKSWDKTHKPQEKNVKEKVDRLVCINDEGKEEILWKRNEEPQKVRYELCDAHKDAVICKNILEGEVIIEIRKFVPKEKDTFPETFTVKKGMNFGGVRKSDNIDFGTYTLKDFGKYKEKAKYRTCKVEYLSEQDPKNIPPHSPLTVEAEGEAEGDGIIIVDSDGKEEKIWLNPPKLDNKPCKKHGGK